MIFSNLKTEIVLKGSLKNPSYSSTRLHNNKHCHDLSVVFIDVHVLKFSYILYVSSRYFLLDECVCLFSIFLLYICITFYYFLFLIYF